MMYKKSKRSSIRRGQIITTFGPGALVNLELGSFITLGIDSWPNTGLIDVLYEERLQSRLKVKYFKQPPSAETYPKGLPFRRFPRWLFCPKCRLLKKYEKWVDSRDARLFPTNPRCPDCKKTLVPMSFIVACRKGHVDDFPWVEWVHHDEYNCGPNPTLRYNTSLAGAGLSGSKIECTLCPAKRTLQGAFSRDAFKSHCTGAMPWTKENMHEPCSERMTTVQRGGSNVYFPKIVSSITIPPYTDTLFDSIRQTDTWQAWITAEGILEDTPELKNKFLKKNS